MIKCPNCGSTAQVGWVWSDDNIYDTERSSDYVCGCGCEFSVIYKAVDTEIIKAPGREKIPY